MEECLKYVAVLWMASYKKVNKQVYEKIKNFKPEYRDQDKSTITSKGVVHDIKNHSKITKTENPYGAQYIKLHSRDILSLILP